MNRHSILSGAAFAAAVAALTWTSASKADTTVVETPPSGGQAVVATPAAEHDSYAGPNRQLIASGLVTFGLSYIPAVIVAGTSDTSTDHHLYVPIVGPWLDLADRPGCGASGIGCDTETTYKVLLVVDGIFQGIGAVTTVWGFLTPEHHEVVSTASLTKPTVHFSPAAVGRSGYGLVALGSF